MSLAAVAFAFAVELVPLEAHAFREAHDVTVARYADFAITVATVALALNEAPLEGLTREQTALVLVNVAARESFFRADVMTCRVRGMGGAVGPFQYQGPRSLVCGSIDQATRWALHQLRESFARCNGLPLGDRASIYTDGACHRAWPRSKVRVLPALQWLREHEEETTNYDDGRG